jgi:hypothetical protein
MCKCTFQLKRVRGWVLQHVARYDFVLFYDSRYLKTSTFSYPDLNVFGVSPSLDTWGSLA